MVKTIELPTPKDYKTVIDFVIAHNYSEILLRWMFTVSNPKDWPRISERTYYLGMIYNREERLKEAQKAAQWTTENLRTVAEEYWRGFKSVFALNNVAAASMDMKEAFKAAGMNPLNRMQKRRDLMKVMTQPNGEEQIIAIIESALPAIWHIALKNYHYEYQHGTLPRNETNRQIFFSIPKGLAASLSTTAMSLMIDGGWTGLALGGLEVAAHAYTIATWIKASEVARGNNPRNLRQMTTNYLRVLRDYGINLSEIEKGQPSVFTERLTATAQRGDSLMTGEEKANLQEDYHRLMEYYQLTEAQLKSSLISLNAMGTQVRDLADAARTSSGQAQVSSIGVAVGNTVNQSNLLAHHIAGFFDYSDLVPERLPLLQAAE